MAEPNIKEKGWFTKTNIQNFIHYFVSEKMKFEKMTLAVSNHFEAFLGGLEKKMKLNEMRVMKPDNYILFRQLIRDPARMGDPFLRILVEKCDVLGVPRNSFSMIFEGFWDVYCKKPASPDLQIRNKLEGWINFVNLINTGPFNGGATERNEAGQGQADDEEEKGEGVEADQTHVSSEPPTIDVKAIVRIRIPLQRKPEEEPEDGENKSENESGRKQNDVSLAEVEDLEDRIMAVNPRGENYNILVLH